jgi:glycosyltransferase involved in cell wall biosynthesis
MPAAGGNGLAMRIGTFLEAYATFADVDCLVVPIAGGAGSDAFCRRHVRRLDLVETAGKAETRFALLASVRDPRDRLAAFQDYGRPSLTAFLSAAVRDEIRARLRGRSYDLVHLSRAYLLPLRDVVAAICPGARVVADLDEDEPATRRSLARLHRLNGDIAHAEWQDAEARAYEVLVQGVLPSIGLATVSSETEAERTRARGAEPSALAVVPNAIRVPPGVAAPGGARRLIFVGGFGYFPNRDAAHWMLRCVWPRIKARCPAAALFLVGRTPHRSLRRLARQPQVSLCDGVSDVAAAYRQSTVAVVPIRAGGGTRIKLLEAGAHALPCVSTHAGAEGLDHAPVLTADRADAFADACVALLRSPDLRIVGGQALRRYVRRWHDRALVIGRIARLVSRLC